MKKIFIIVFLSITFFVFPVVFLLNDGSIINGKIKEINNQSITVTTENGEIEIMHGDIKSTYIDMNAYNAQMNKVEKTDEKSEQEKVGDEESIDKIEGMVFVRGSTFSMGNDSIESSIDEKPEHDVILNDFYIGIHEVTQREWREVMKNNPSSVMGDDYPVQNVTWFEAVDFCNKKSLKEGLTPCYRVLKKEKNKIECDFTATGYRLPTEAEWEYAARGGDKSKGYKYSGSNRLSDVANENTQKVGEKKPNELGIYDMSGNVVEWCWDWYNISYYDEKEKDNPQGPLNGIEKVVRGGYFNGFTGSCRVSAREKDFPIRYCYDFTVFHPIDGSNSHVITYYGFRTARSAEGYKIEDNNKKRKTENKKIADIFKAVKNDDSSALKSFIENGGDVNARDRDGNTALIICAKTGRDDLIRTLIDAKSDVNAKDKYGNTAFIFAVKNGDADIAKLLIDSKASVNEKNDEGWSALIYSSKNGDSGIVKLLIDAGADVNAVNSDGNDSLMFAAKYGHTDIVKELLKAGADAGIKNKEGWNALTFADKFKRIEAGNLLKKYLVPESSVENKNSSGSQSSSTERISDEIAGVFNSAGKGELGEVKKFIDNGGNVNIRGKGGMTLLMQTALTSRTEIMKMLIASKADVNAKDDAGWTALMWGVVNGNVETVKILIEAGEDVKAKNKNGVTALMLAYINGFSEAVKILKDAGAAE